MKKITSLIRADSEFSGFVACLSDAYGSTEGLPIAVNGLTGGAEAAFLAEAVREAREISKRPVLVLTESEGEREKAVKLLSNAGMRALSYKKRDLVFHNIRASHDVDRERLSVLSALIEGDCDVVVSTPSAAAVSTMPRKMLAKMTAILHVGDVIAPEELTERLAYVGFARVDTVESKGPGATILSFLSILI